MNLRKDHYLKLLTETLAICCTKDPRKRTSLSRLRGMELYPGSVNGWNAIPAEPLGRADDPRISRFRDRTKILCRTGMYLSSAEGRHTNISDGGGGTEP